MTTDNLKCMTCGGPWDSEIDGYQHRRGCPQAPYQALYEARPFPYRAQPKQASVTGWICPRCGSGIAPWVLLCPFCQRTQAPEGAETGVSQEESDDARR